MKHGMIVAWSIVISGAALADEVKLTSGRVFEGIAREEASAIGPAATDSSARANSIAEG